MAQVVMPSACLGLLNNSLHMANKSHISDQPGNGGECSKKSVQQGRSRFDARSVRFVREHGKRARTPLAAFFNIPDMENLEAVESARKIRKNFEELGI